MEHLIRGEVVSGAFAGAERFLRVEPLGNLRHLLLLLDCDDPASASNRRQPCVDDRSIKP